MRWRKLIAVVGLAVLITAVAVVLWPRLDRFTQENYQPLH
jgi:hypothetical protein